MARERPSRRRPRSPPTQPPAAKRARTDLLPYLRDERWALRVGYGALPELCERRGRAWRTVGALEMPPELDTQAYAVVLETHDGLRAAARINGEKYAYTGLRPRWRLPRDTPTGWMGNALLAVGLEDEGGDPPPEPETDRLALLLRWGPGAAADCVPAAGAGAGAGAPPPRPPGRVVHHRLRHAANAVICAEGLLVWRRIAANAMPETCLLAWDGREWPFAAPVDFPTRWAVSPNGRTVLVAEHNRLQTGPERWVTLRPHARGCAVVRDGPRGDRHDAPRLPPAAAGLAPAFETNAVVCVRSRDTAARAVTLPDTRAALAALGRWRLPPELHRHVGGFLLGARTPAPADVHAAVQSLLWPGPGD